MSGSGWADLHAHSDRSDGTDAPARVVERAAAAGLTAIALTDHDTTAGLDEAMAAGRRLGVEVIPGLELSTSFEGRETHLLAYFFRIEEPELQSLLGRMIGERERRVERMVGKLNDHGIRVTVNDVRSFAAGRSLGRPHVADALVKGGHVPSYEIAWSDYVGMKGKAWVERDKLTLEEGVASIRRAGGVTSIAHPTMNLDHAALERAAAAGIDALEATHPRVAEPDAALLRDLCRRSGLIETGGSDCHGTRRGGPSLGRCRVPMETVERLRSLART